MEAAKTYPKLKKAPKYRFVAFILMTLVYILTYAGLQVFNSAGTQIDHLCHNKKNMHFHFKRHMGQKRKSDGIYQRFLLSV